VTARAADGRGVSQARYRGRCGDCGGLIEPGDPIKHYPGSGDFGALTFHGGDCPRAPEARGQNVARPDDSEELFELARCSRCGGDWTARRSTGGLPYGCPAPGCGGAWERAA
jgi:hypothetical protein